MVADLYTGVATTAAGDIIPITPAEWDDHCRYVSKGSAVGDSGVTTGMHRLAPACLLESYRDIANATRGRGRVRVGLLVTGGHVPDRKDRGDSED